MFSCSNIKSILHTFTALPVASLYDPRRGMPTRPLCLLICFSLFPAHLSQTTQLPFLLLSSSFQSRQHNKEEKLQGRAGSPLVTTVRAVGELWSVRAPGIFGSVDGCPDIHNPTACVHTPKACCEMKAIKKDLRLLLILYFVDIGN